MVKNPPSSAGGVGLFPGQGTKIPYSAGQLSLCIARKTLQSQKKNSKGQSGPFVD